jgi:hypothetical protein
VAAAVKVEFGLSVLRHVVEDYDPTKSSGRQMAKRWVDLFHAKRAEYISDIDRIGIRHRADRLRALDRSRRDAEKAQNRPLALQAIEMAAKEVGDFYINRWTTAEDAPTQERAVPHRRLDQRPTDRCEGAGEGNVTRLMIPREVAP